MDFMPKEKIRQEKPAIIISQSANMSHWPTSNQTIGAMISSAEAVNRFFAGDKGLLLMHVPSHPASNLGPLSARHSGGISLANVVGITHIFHALTFSGSRGSCLNTRQGHINNSELILSIFTFKPMF